MPFDMPKSYNLRSGRERQLKCYVQRLSENYSPQDFSPEVRLKRLKILESPEQKNFRFYIKQDRIIRTHNGRCCDKIVLIAFILSIILFTLTLFHHHDKLQVSEVIPFRKFKKLHSNMKEYFVKENFKWLFMFGFLKNVEEKLEYSQDGLIKLFDEVEIKDLVKMYVSESNCENTISQLPFPFVEKQCSIDSKPTTVEESQLKTYKFYNSTYFESGNLTDYALASQGAKIVSIFDTKPYSIFTVKFLGYDVGSILNNVLLAYMNSLNAKGPTSILTPWKKPGDCWAFKGSQGKVQIQLSQSVMVTAITIDHIPTNLSPSGNVFSAPKKFSAFGIVDSGNQTMTQHLGNYEYKEKGPPMQTFSVDVKTKTPISKIKLFIESNHGNEKYTCLYKVRVHGYT